MALKSGSRPPWVGLAAAVWVEVAAACHYTFALYSKDLKSVMRYNQEQLSLLGVANNLGENFGLIAGLACNSFQPWFVLLLGAVLSFLGYGTIWLAVTQTVTGLPYWLMWIAQCVAANSSAWFCTAVLVTNMRNFPLSRGTVAGIIKGYIGLSASVYSGLFSGALQSTSTKLLLFLAVGLPIISIAMMSLVRPCVPSTVENSSEKLHFLFVQISSITLGVYILVFSIWNSQYTLSQTANTVFFAVMIILLMAPSVIPLKMTLFHAPKTTATVEPSASSEPLLPESTVATAENDDDETDVMNTILAEGEGAVKRKRKPRRGDDFNLGEAMVKADFWLLFVVFFLGTGSGVTVLNNLAQIGSAVGVNDTTLLLCIFSFCNFLGRLGGGAVSEEFVKSKLIPRSVWMTVTQTIMIATHLLFASAISSFVYVSTALLGLCYGVQYSAMVPTVSELFGLKHFGFMFNFMMLGNPLGSFLFSFVAGYVYDKEASKQHLDLSGSSGHSNTCMGPNCFRLTFFVLAGACLLGALLSIVLSVRIRPVYKMLYAGGSFKHPRSGQLH